MRFLFDLKYDANEIQNFPFVGGVCRVFTLCVSANKPPKW